METSWRFFILLKWKRRAAILRAKFARHALNANVSLAWLFGSSFPESQQQSFRNETPSRRIVNPWRGMKRVLLMDILASMLAYLVTVAGVIAALAVSFVIFFANPGQQPSNPAAQDVAAMTAPRLVDMATAAQVKRLAQVKQTDTRVTSGAPQSKAMPPATIAIDAQQKPLTSSAQLRRLADEERAKRLAYRANSDFESRFLHYDD
jgi:hypothetical protein